MSGERTAYTSLTWVKTYSETCFYLSLTIFKGLPGSRQMPPPQNYLHIKENKLKERKKKHFAGRVYNATQLKHSSYSDYSQLIYSSLSPLRFVWAFCLYSCFFFLFKEFLSLIWFEDWCILYKEKFQSQTIFFFFLFFGLQRIRNYDWWRRGMAT